MRYGCNATGYERWQGYGFSFSESDACATDAERGLLPRFVRETAANYRVEAGTQRTVMF
jgi:hypothetical protein